MSFKELLEKHSKMAAGLSVVVLMAALLLALRGIQPNNRLRDAKWVYDLNTGLIGVTSRDTPAPIDAGNGSFSYPEMSENGSQVDAVIFTCGDPSDVSPGMSVEQLAEVQAHIGYLTRLPDQAAQARARGETFPPGTEAPRLVSAVDGQRWVRSESDASGSIIDPVAALCGGDFPRAVRP